MISFKSRIPSVGGEAGMAEKENRSGSSKNKFLKSKKRTWIVFAVSVLVLIGIIVSAIVIFIPPKPIETRETVFIEQETEIIKPGEVIQINDPELGLIEIEAVPGIAKNNYDLNAFRYNENGYKVYYIDDQIASCEGIDLSNYQGEVDFEQVKASGIDYVILRVGGRGYGEEGDIYPDSSFSAYYHDAKAAGLLVGVYFFSQATTVEEGVEEANYTIDAIKDLEIDYPVVFDWEPIHHDNARTDNVTGEQLTDIALSFLNTVKDAGYEPMWYTNTSHLYYAYDLERMKNYDLWIADYGEYPSAYYYFTMWQYTATSMVPGVEGDVDINICFKNY